MVEGFIHHSESTCHQLTMPYVSSSIDGRGGFCFCFGFRLTEKSNRTVVILPHCSNQSLSSENCPPKTLFFYNPESKTSFAITSEFSKLGRFVYSIFVKELKYLLLLIFECLIINEIQKKKTMYVFIYLKASDS